MSDTRAAKPDLSFLAASAFSDTEMALEAVKRAGQTGELWVKAELALEKAYDALSGIRRSQ